MQLMARWSVASASDEENRVFFSSLAWSASRPARLLTGAIEQAKALAIGHGVEL
jgi:hypothetical protein